MSCKRHEACLHVVHAYPLTAAIGPWEGYFGRDCIS
jgi:hypothetical protein